MCPVRLQTPVLFHSFYCFYFNFFLFFTFQVFSYFWLISCQYNGSVRLFLIFPKRSKMFFNTSLHISMGDFFLVIFCPFLVLFPSLFFDSFLLPFAGPLLTSIPALFYSSFQYFFTFFMQRFRAFFICRVWVSNLSVPAPVVMAHRRYEP